MFKLVVLSVLVALAASKPSELLGTLSSSSSITTQEKTEIHHGPALVASSPLIKTSEYIATRPVLKSAEIVAPITTEIRQVPILRSDIITPGAVSHQFRSDVHHRNPIVQTEIHEARPLVEVKSAIPATVVEAKTRFVEHRAPLVQKTEIFERAPLVRQTEISHHGLYAAPGLYEYAAYPRYAVSPYSRYSTVDRYEIPTFAAAELGHLPLRYVLIR